VIIYLALRLLSGSSELLLTHSTFREKSAGFTLAPDKDLAVSSFDFVQDKLLYYFEGSSRRMFLSFRFGTSLFAPLSSRTTAVSRYLFNQPLRGWIRICTNLVRFAHSLIFTNILFVLISEAEGQDS
jgi:hypothetical protein